MSVQAVHFAAVLPIPVGHEVEVRIYAVEEGLFSKAWVPRTNDPFLVDRTTGVVYGAAWHFQDITMYQSGTIMPNLPMNVRADLREHARMVGVVKSTRIAWIGAGDSRFPQTTLLIEPR